MSCSWVFQILPGVDPDTGHICSSVMKKLNEESLHDVDSSGIDIDICKYRCCVYADELAEELYCSTCKYPRYRLWREKACKNLRVLVNEEYTEVNVHKFFNHFSMKDEHNRRKANKKGKNKKSFDKTAQRLVSLIISNLNVSYQQPHNLNLAVSVSLYLSLYLYLCFFLLFYPYNHNHIPTKLIFLFDSDSKAV